MESDKTKGLDRRKFDEELRKTNSHRLKLFARQTYSASRLKGEEYTCSREQLFKIGRFRLVSKVEG